MAEEKPELPHKFDDYESRRDVIDTAHGRNSGLRRRQFHADLPLPNEKVFFDTDDNGTFETRRELNSKTGEGVNPKPYADSERGYGSGVGGSYPPDSYDSDQEETAFFGRPHD